MKGLKSMIILSLTFALVSAVNAQEIGLEGALRVFKKNKDIVVAVIDTGIDFKHPLLAGNIWVPNGKANENFYGKDFSKSTLTANAPVDAHGHGTHIAGIIKSVYSDVKILALKYYNPTASGEEN